MATRLFHINAFADRSFTGNPAAVFLLERAAEPKWMQSVAAEMQAPASAFLHRDDGNLHLRWFSPRRELALCGHGTLAAAHVAWDTGVAAAGSPVAFHTQSGLLTATRDDGWIALDLPSTPAEPAEPPGGLADALGVTPVDVGRSRFDYLVALQSPEIVASVEPDLAALARIDARGFIVTSAAADGCDFVSRFFAPAFGIDEDPATGSAHCCLGPYWQKRLGKSSFVARQISPRGATIRVAVNGDRVSVAGRAVTLAGGEWVGSD